MNNIYVDGELPKCCAECPCSYECADVLHFCQGRYGFATYINDEVYETRRMKDCPLKLLSDRLAEERKKVVLEVKQKLCRIEDTLINLGNGKEDALNYFVKILDQIERGE